MVNIKKILSELKKLPAYDRQIMLQTVKGETDPFYGTGRLSESNHSEEKFIYPLFNMPYTNNLLKELKMTRSRVMKLVPFSCYSYHQDLTKRIHIPLVTNENCFMVIDDEIHRYPNDGNYYLVDTTKKHTFINASNRDRIHIVGCV